MFFVYICLERKLHILFQKQIGNVRSLTAARFEDHICIEIYHKNIKLKSKLWVKVQFFLLENVLLTRFNIEPKMWSLLCTPWKSLFLSHFLFFQHCCVCWDTGIVLVNTFKIHSLILFNSKDNVIIYIILNG